MNEPDWIDIDVKQGEFECVMTPDKPFWHIEVTAEAAQKIMDQFWELGLRPTQEDEHGRDER